MVLAGVLGAVPNPTSGPPAATAATAPRVPTQVAYPPFKPPVVLVYGDSIVHAAGPALEAMLAPHGIAVVDASVGGTAPCDALQFVPGDMVKYDPDLVVVAYVGNAFSPCINGTPDKDVIMRHYVDTQKLISEVDRPVLLATPPGRIGEGRYTSYDVLVWYEASLFGTGLVDTAKVLLDPRQPRLREDRAVPERGRLPAGRRARARRLPPVGVRRVPLRAGPREGRARAPPAGRGRAGGRRYPQRDAGVGVCPQPGPRESRRGKQVKDPYRCAPGLVRALNPGPPGIPKLFLSGLPPAHPSPKRRPRLPGGAFVFPLPDRRSLRPSLPSRRSADEVGIPLRTGKRSVNPTQPLPRVPQRCVCGELGVLPLRASAHRARTKPLLRVSSGFGARRSVTSGAPVTAARRTVGRRPGSSSGR